jgi:glycosyltransferase involved in cell wall biosynthesis
MRILQVCSAESLGGGERHVADLTRALSERGHQLHLVTRSSSPLRPALADLTLKWHELPLRNALDIFSAWRLRSIIHQEKIEVLHAHVARDYPICGLATKYLPVRLFLTRHHFHPIKANRLYRWAVGHAHNLIAVSESVGASLKVAFPALADHIVVIPNWIDARAIGQFSREEARARLGITHRLAVGVIGQLTPLKRQDLFIRAAASLINERGYGEVAFLIIGAAGPQDARYEEQLRRLADELGVTEQVRFMGYVAELPAYLAAFDIIAVPSHNEAFSLTLVEAMAAGCAVVASRVGGMMEILEGEVTGLLVAPDDEAELIAGLERLLADEHLRARLGAAAQPSALKRFGREQVINRIEQLYLEQVSTKT